MNALYATSGISPSSRSLVCWEPSTIAFANALRTAHVVDVGVGEHEAANRAAQPVDRGGERLPLRPHHQGVDDGDPVVVDDRARVG